MICCRLFTAAKIPRLNEEGRRVQLCGPQQNLLHFVCAKTSAKILKGPLQNFAREPIDGRQRYISRV